MDNEIYNKLVSDIEYFIHRISTPSWFIEESSISFVDVTYIVSGKAEYTIDNTSYMVSPGDLLCIPRGSLRSAIGFPENPIECYSFNGQVQLISGNSIALPFPLVSHIGLLPDIIDLYRELNAVWLSRDSGYGMRALSVWLMILQRYFQLLIYKTDSSNVDNRIKKVLRYVVDHYEEAITVQSMADFVGLSPWYFGNFFKQETGTSFKEYLTSIRLNRAEDLLRSGEYNVSEVSDMCGFSNIYYFCKIFKRNRGITPSTLIHYGKK